MKAMSMPINIVVVLLLAVLILAAMIIWFMSIVPPTTQQTTWQTVLRNCCIKWVSLGCGDTKDITCTVPQGMTGNNCKSNNCNINDVAGDAQIADIKTFCGC